MKFTTSQLSNYLGISTSGIRRKAIRENWKFEEVDAPGGFEKLYDLADLPEKIQAKILASKTDNQELEAGKQIGRKAAFGDSTGKTLEKNMKEQSLQRTEFTPSEQQRLDAKLTILRAWHAFRLSSGKSKNASSTLFAEDYNAGQIDLPTDVMTAIPSVSGPSLLKWERQAAKEGAVRLAGKYGGRKGKSKIDQQPELFDFMEGMISTYPHIEGKWAYESMVARYSEDNTLELPGMRSVQRWIVQWKKKKHQTFTAVSNPDAWKNKYMVAHGSMSEGIERLNQLWELDGTPADLMLLDGRHVITGCIDVYSRRKRYLVTKTARATANVALLRRCLLDWGVPEKVKMDNGTDYKNYHLDRVLYDLAIESDFCQPFSPWMKPHIERSFRTFSHSLVELMDGYIGHNVADRKAIEARKSFADRLFKKNETIDVNLTSEQLQEFCDEWCDQIYFHDMHEGVNGKTPFDLVSEYRGEIVHIQNERALDLLLAEAPNNHGRRTVQKKGISIKWAGEPVKHWYSSPELGLHVGNDVRVHYDPTDDMGRVYVFADIGFICIAECPELLGISRKEHAQEAKRIQSKFIQEERRKLKEKAKNANIGSIAEEIRRHKLKQTRGLSLFPKRSAEHTSEGLEAANKAVDSEVASLKTNSVSQEARAALEKEIAGQAEITHLPPEKPRQKYLRWCEIDRLAHAEKTLTESERRFWKSYPETPEWKSQKMIAEDFSSQLNNGENHD